MRVRVVNVTDLMVLGPDHPHSLTDEAFGHLFTKDRAVVFNYHSYPGELRSLLFGRPNTGRFQISGYNEEGTTTTPFDMMLANSVSRYHVCTAAIRGASLVNEKIAIVSANWIGEYKHRAQKAREYALEHGQGMSKSLHVSLCTGISSLSFLTDT